MKSSPSLCAWHEHRACTAVSLGQWVKLKASPIRKIACSQGTRKGAHCPANSQLRAGSWQRARFPQFRHAGRGGGRGHGKPLGQLTQEAWADLPAPSWDHVRTVPTFLLQLPSCEKEKMVALTALHRAV